MSLGGRSKRYGANHSRDSSTEVPRSPGWFAHARASGWRAPVPVTVAGGLLAPDFPLALVDLRSAGSVRRPSSGLVGRASPAEDPVSPKDGRRSVVPECRSFAPHAAASKTAEQQTTRATRSTRRQRPLEPARRLLVHRPRQPRSCRAHDRAPSCSTRRRHCNRCDSCRGSAGCRCRLW